MDLCCGPESHNSLQVSCGQAGRKKAIILLVIPHSNNRITTIGRKEDIGVVLLGGPKPNGTQTRIKGTQTTDGFG